MLATMMSHATATATAPCPFTSPLSLPRNDTTTTTSGRRTVFNFIIVVAVIGRVTQLVLPDDSVTNARTSWSSASARLSLYFFNVSFSFSSSWSWSWSWSSSSFSSSCARGRMLHISYYYPKKEVCLFVSERERRRNRKKTDRRIVTIYRYPSEYTGQMVCKRYWSIIERFEHMDEAGPKTFQARSDCEEIIAIYPPNRFSRSR